jgi:hypothetical protein
VNDAQTISNVIPATSRRVRAAEDALIWSSLKVTAGSYFLVVLRLRIDSMMALVMVILIGEGIG